MAESNTKKAASTPVVAGPVRDARGHFVKGNQEGFRGGRPRGYDLRAIAEAKSAEEGIDIKEALWAVLKALIKNAMKGDTAAAKIVLDRLTLAPDKLSLRISADQPLTASEVRTRLSAILTSEALHDDDDSDEVEDA